MDELSEALKKLKEQAKAGKDFMRTMAKDAWEAQRKAKARQDTAYKAIAEAEAADAIEAERLHQIELEKQAAVAKAKAEKAAALAEKKVREAEEKAAFEARTELKRQQSSAKLALKPAASSSALTA